MKTIYKVYRDRLVEITGKSRSLYSKNASTKQSYNIGKLLSGSKEESESFINYIWSGGQGSFRLLSPRHIDTLLRELRIEDNTPAVKQKYIESEQRKLVQLKREIDEIKRDTGKYELFVGYPFVEGLINKNISVKAPLLLFPVRVDIDKEVEITLIKDQPIQLNKVLLLAYSREMRLKATDILMEFDQFSEQFPSISAVNSFLAQHNIKLNYTPNKKIITNIEQSHEHSGNLEILHHCVLGRFPLANSIYYDYNELFRKKLTSPPLEALLANKLPKNKEKRTNTEYFSTHSLDFAQSSAIEKCDKQKHMVIYGPPGTGKSQTIASMIVDNICKGKSSLVVSQKRSALDVVYNRLAAINSKAVILPDPEKNKVEFFNKVKARFNEIQNYKPQFDQLEYNKFCTILEGEISELRTISNALFSTTSFGLTLQQMYSMSSNIARDTSDYELYTALLKSDIMKMNYSQLNDVCVSIEQRNKGKLFYDHITLLASNPLIDYIKTEIDVHSLNQAKSFLRKLIEKEHVPFNIGGYAYSRYMLVYNLEQHESTSVKPLVEMIAKSENPALFGALKFTYIPLLWPCFPFIKYKCAKICKQIKNKILTAENAVRRFVNEFTLLETVLEREGLAMVIDSIAYGNDTFIKKLMATLDDYVSVRAMKLALSSITDDERKVINFAIENSKTQAEFYTVLKKILPIRIYHEVIEHERRSEQVLSKTIIYEDLRKRITELKNEERDFSMRLAMDSFNAQCKELFERDPENTKNFIHQISKQRGQWPIRRLIEHFEQFLLAMFPCWLLSPEAVSSVLPLREGMFDVVLFDEASQLFIESTIPAVYRGKSLVVAGDNKQLRPTSVFVKRYMGDDTYDADASLNTQAIMEVESLLDLASSRLNATHLTYHYRSRHEELINFSNYAFYEGKLQIAPNISKNTDYLPIERIKVNGRWVDRRNHEEAKEVVRIVKNIFKTRKNNETIGIVTFNTDQEEYIKDLFDVECVQSPQFRNDYLREISRVENGEDFSLFVKNLENVQGDERDIIIFSIAYARNLDGKLSTQFGTLSLSGGENRLNVAITRAVKKVYVVTSVEPEEFVNINEAKNEGPKLLVKYLQYARAVSERNDTDVKLLLESMGANQRIKNNDIGDFERNLKKEIEALGYSVEINLGNADYKISLAVYDKTLDRYLLGIECDYSAHVSSDSMMERDVYRINFLNSRGWDIMRVWSRDWWLGKSGLMKQIENRINSNRAAIIERQQANNQQIPAQTFYPIAKPVQATQPAPLTTQTSLNQPSDKKPATKTTTKATTKKVTAPTTKATSNKTTTTTTSPAKPTAANAPAKPTTASTSQAKPTATNAPAKSTTTSAPAKSTATSTSPAKSTTTTTPAKSTTASASSAKQTTSSSTSTSPAKASTATSTKTTITNSPAKSAAKKTEVKSGSEALKGKLTEVKTTKTKKNSATDEIAATKPPKSKE